MHDIYGKIKDHTPMYWIKMTEIFMCVESKMIFTFSKKNAVVESVYNNNGDDNTIKE